MTVSASTRGEYTAELSVDFRRLIEACRELRMGDKEARALRTARKRAAKDAARGRVLVPMPASTRNARRLNVRASQGCSEFADVVRVLRCGLAPREWCGDDVVALAKWRKERNAKRRARKAWR